MRSLALVMLLAACRNDAITFAHVIDPTATCTALITNWLDFGTDTAACSSRDGEKWFCTADCRGSIAPKCERVFAMTTSEQRK